MLYDIFVIVVELLDCLCCRRFLVFRVLLYGLDNLVGCLNSGVVFQDVKNEALIYCLSH